MVLFLTILSGLCWCIVYEECIRIGFSKETYVMPFFALGLNLAWEAVYTFSDIFFLAHDPLVGMNLIQVIVNITWVCLDLITLWTYCKYGQKEWQSILSRRAFVYWTLLIIICCFLLQIAFIQEFGFMKAAIYAAFLQNLVMSLLFIKRYLTVGHLGAQSKLLAIAKWIGTLAPSILFGLSQNNWLVLTAGIFCSVFDFIYIILLTKPHYISSQKA